VIELFAGAAGLVQGFLRAGSYKALALFDILKTAKQSYQKRYPDVVYQCCDVLDLDERDMWEAVSGRRIYGVLGRLPCQGFSLAGSKNPKHDKNSPVGRYVHLVKQLHPDFLLMENVPQLLCHEQFANLQTKLGQDYYLTYTILNAAQYGVPQTRHRLFVLAYRKDRGIVLTWPQPTHVRLGQSVYSYRSKDLLPLSQQSSDEILGTDPVTVRVLKKQKNTASCCLHAGLRPLVTVQDAISDLYPLRVRAESMPYPKPTQTPSGILRSLQASDGNDEILEELLLRTTSFLETVTPDPLTLEEASDIYGVKAATLRRACWSGKLPAKMRGKTWFMNSLDLERYLAASKKKSARRSP